MRYLAEELYTQPTQVRFTMRNRLHHAAVVATYQLSILLGIMLLPLAVGLNRSVGIDLPLHRILNPLRAAYDANTTPADAP